VDAPDPAHLVEVAVEGRDIPNPLAGHEGNARAVRHREGAVVLQVERHRPVQQVRVNEDDVAVVEEVLVERPRRLPAAAIADDGDAPPDNLLYQLI